MKPLAIFLLILSSTAASADVPESEWNALYERIILIELSDGGRAAGLLVEVQKDRIIVLRRNGQILEILKTEIGKVEDVTPAEQRPLGRSYVLFNALGFLLIGPVLEFGMQVLPETTFGVHYRSSPLGLMYHAMLSNGFEDQVSWLSGGAGVNITRFFKFAKSVNRFYLGLNVDFDWSRTLSDEGTPFEEIQSIAFIVVFPALGYRWRFRSGFFMNVGIFGGGAFELWQRWWYTTAPEIVEEGEIGNQFAGGLELSLGLEF